MTLIPDSLWIDSPPSTEKAVSVYRGLNINKQPSYIRAIKGISDRKDQMD